VYWFFLGYEGYEKRAKPTEFPLSGARSNYPPEPRLEQVDRQQEVENLSVYRRREKQEDLLNSYGTTDEPGYFHIPIGRAMKLLENKLPVRKDKRRPNWREAGLVGEGASNSGRMFREPKK
jgi:hypothetical protein